jgi:hypothetical protein
MALLTKEMENMIIEGTLRQEGRGASPLRGALESVFERKRFFSVGPTFGVKKVKDEEDEEQEDIDGRLGKGQKGMLPSPRPSPPPQSQPHLGLVRRGSSFVRARSVSC